MSVSARIEGRVAWLTLERAEQMNALDVGMLLSLEERLLGFEIDPDVRVLVVTGSGTVFCAGADLKSVTRPVQAGEPDFLDHAARVFGLLRRYPKPVVAAVNGIAMAGGLELALCCDLIVAAESARIGDAHANFGVFPGAGGAAVLPRKLPLNIAKFLLFTGETVAASMLAAHGLVNEVVPDAELAARVQALAEKIATQSPLVLRKMKRVANASADKSEVDALAAELLELRDHMRSHDFAEGLAAFAEKRKPVFAGR